MTNVAKYQRMALDTALVRAAACRMLASEYFQDEDGYWYDEPREVDYSDFRDANFVDYIMCRMGIDISCLTYDKKDLPHLTDLEGQQMITEWLEYEGMQLDNLIDAFWDEVEAAAKIGRAELKED